MFNRLKSLLDNPWGIGFLSALFLGAAVSYVLLGRFDQPESMILLLGMSGFLLFFSFIYIRHMENIPMIRWAGFGMTVWLLGWLVENISQKSGILGGYYHYDYSQPHAFSLGRVPVLIPTIWLLFSLLVGSINHYLNFHGDIKREARIGAFSVWKLLRNCLICGSLMVSIDFAIEWHFSSIVGFWKWRIEAGPDLEGIPMGNFLLWFSLGFLVPILEKGTAVPERKYLRSDWLLQALPALGLCVLLGAGGIMNISYGFLTGAFLCGSSLCLLSGFILAKELNNARKPVFKEGASGDESSELKKVLESVEI